MFNLAVETVADRNKDLDIEAQTMGGIFNHLMLERYFYLEIIIFAGS